MIATPPLIPTAQWAALSLAIARGDTDRVRNLVEENHLDVNAFLDNSSWMPVLMEALLSNGFGSESERLPLLRYLLERGANPNICCRRGYNCLHIAVQQEKYIHALELMLGFNADVNIPDQDGASIVYWAIQGFLLRKEDGANRPVFLRVLEKILLLGADLDQKNRYDMNARGWLDHAAPEVRELVAQVEAHRPAVRAIYTVQPAFPTNLQYLELAQKIWTELVPSTGPASTVQGELLRAVEKLRDEAQRNGNQNYGKTHRRMAVFVRDTLLRSGAFDKSGNEQIRSGTRQLMKASKPYTQDDVYDHLVDQVCVFYSRKEEPIPYKAAGN
jgi:ankyrin repeat protein